jgi:hypothetical protein
LGFQNLRPELDLSPLQVESRAALYSFGFLLLFVADSSGSFLREIIASTMPTPAKHRVQTVSAITRISHGTASSTGGLPWIWPASHSTQTPQWSSQYLIGSRSLLL